VRARLFLWTALFLCLAGQAPAETVPPPATPEGVLSFAQALLRSGESFRAVTEYLRFLHHYPDHPEVPTAVEGLGSAYAQAGRWDEAVSAFFRLSELAPGDRSRRMLGSALYRARRYPESAQVLLGSGPREADSTLGTLAALRAGAPDPLPRSARADVADEYRGLEKKSPALAGTLSAALPGAGHLYADRPRDAAVSFVVNGLFLWGTYEAVRKEEWALAGVLGLFELGWYTGNIVSAVNAAHKWNQREEGRFFERWEAGALPQWGLVLAPSAAGVALAWRW